MKRGCPNSSGKASSGRNKLIRSTATNGGNGTNNSVVVSEMKQYFPSTNSNVVFIDGIPPNFTNNELKLLVFPCGKAMSFKICPKRTGSGSIAFVEFLNVQDAQKAVALLNLRQLADVRLAVGYASAQAPSNAIQSR
mmetsp:Transcript_21683/g.53079  ORF Transcript_21683/g.53079 Transcript_21683/m.53079 type:complete len:137 (+) Transcript_21683:220-630(+)